MRRIGSACLVWLCVLGSARGQDGLFADFSTSMGDFIVDLDYARAPRAVASFVGLATGEGGWLDAQSNVWHRPFYDGSLFHRVVKDDQTNGIAIQGGGLLTRTVNTNTGVVTTNFLGPGYTMLEGTTNGLAHSNGVISMANSGPNTDGSQFFITAADMPGWDGSYSVFGHVTTGMDVVASIAAVAVQGAGSRPVEDVVLDRVAIRRVGAAAEAFDVAAQGVPSPESTPMRVDRNGDDLDIQIELATQTRPLMLSESADLMDWDHGRLLPTVDFYTNGTQILPGSVPMASMGNKYFFHSSRIRYPVPVTAPTNHRGRIYTFVWNTSPPATNESHFGPNAEIPGVSYEWAGTNAMVTSQLLSGWESWTRDAYSAYLVSLDSRFYYYYYSLGFGPGAATNRFSCRRVHGISGATAVFSGTFTVQ